MFWKTENFESKDGATLDQFAYQIADWCEAKNHPLPSVFELECGDRKISYQEVATFAKELDEWFEYLEEKRKDDSIYREECRGLMSYRLQGAL